MPPEEKLYQLIEVEGSFLVRLRMGEGFDQAAFAELIHCIWELKEKYAGKEWIPKRVAFCLVELPSIMMGCLGPWYQEDVRTDVEKAAGELDHVTKSFLGGLVKRCMREHGMRPLGTDFGVFLRGNLMQRVRFGEAFSSNIVAKGQLVGLIVLILNVWGCSTVPTGCAINLPRGYELYGSYCGGCHQVMAGLQDSHSSLEVMAGRPGASLDDPVFASDSLDRFHWHVERMSDCEVLNLKNYLVYFAEVEFEHLHGPRP